VSWKDQLVPLDQPEQAAEPKPQQSWRDQLVPLDAAPEPTAPAQRPPEAGVLQNVVDAGTKTKGAVANLMALGFDALSPDARPDDVSWIDEALAGTASTIGGFTGIDAIKAFGDDKGADIAMSYANEELRRRAQGMPGIAEENLGKWGNLAAESVIAAQDERADRALSDEQKWLDQQLGESIKGGAKTTAQFLWDNPGQIAQLGVESIPYMLPAAGIGRLAGVFGKGAGIAGSVLSETQMAAMLSRQGVEQMIDGLPDKELAKTEAYQVALEQTGDPAAARALMRSMAGNAAFGTGFVTNLLTLGASQAAGANVVQDVLAGVAKKGKGGVIARTGKGAAKEVTQEAIQEPGDQLAENVGAVVAGEKTPDQALEGLAGASVVGGAAAAGPGALAGLAQGKEPETPEPAPPEPEPTQDEIDAEIERLLEEQRAAEQAEAEQSAAEQAAAAVIPQMETPAQPAQQAAAAVDPVNLADTLGSILAGEQDAPAQPEPAVEPEPEPIEPFVPANEAEQAVVDGWTQEVMQASEARLIALEGEGVQVRDETGALLPREQIAQNFANHFQDMVGEQVAMNEEAAQEPEPEAEAAPEPGVTVGKVVRDGKRVEIDPRLKRAEYREPLAAMLDELVPGGGISVAPAAGAESRRRSDGSVMQDYEDTIRTPSVNPDWFKNNDQGFTVAQAKNAVEAALEGRNMGVRQEEFVMGLIEIIRDNRTGADPRTGEPAYDTWQDMLRDFREQRDQAKAREFGNLEGWMPEYLEESNEVYNQAYEEYINEQIAEQSETANPRAGTERRESRTRETNEITPEPTAEEINRAEEKRRDGERDGLGRDEVTPDQGEGELFAGNTPGQRPEQGDVFDANSSSATQREPATDAQKQEMRRIIAERFPEYADRIVYKPRFEGAKKGFKFAEYDRANKQVIVYEDYAGLMNEGALVWLINHELFHGGLDTAFKQQRIQVLQAAAKNPTISDLAQRIAQKRREPFNELEHTEEAIVELATANEINRLERLGRLYQGFVAPASLTGETQSLIGRWLDTMRNIMDSLINRASPMTDGEILNVIRVARGGMQELASDTQPAQGRNRLVSDEAKARADAKLKSGLTKLNSGVDPELWAAMAVKAAWHIENGARDFADFSKRMLEEFGDVVQPHLDELWSRGRNYLAGRQAAEDGEAGGTTTSLQNRVINQRREQRGEEPLSTPDSRTWEEALAWAEARVAQNPNVVQEILERIGTEPDPQLSDRDSAILLYRMQQIQNQLADLDARVENSVYAQREAAALQAELYELEVASRQIGTATGRALAFRKAILNKEFTLERMEQRARADLGRPLNKAERATLKARAEKIKDFDKEIDESEKRGEKRQKTRAQSIIDLMKADREKVKKAAPKQKRKSKGPSVRSRLDNRTQEQINRGKRNLKAAQKELMKAMGMDGINTSLVLGVGLPKFPEGNPLKDPKAYKSMAKIAGALVDIGFWRSAQFATELAGAVGDKIFSRLRSEDIEHLREQAIQDAEEEAFYLDPESSDEVLREVATMAFAGDEISSRFVYRLARAFMEEGLQGEDAIMGAVHKALQEIRPDITERDVRRAFVEYGKAKYPSQEEVARDLREMRTLVRLQESIDRLAEDKLPKRTGMQRDEATAAIRERQKLLNNMRKEFDARNPEQASRDSLRGMNEARLKRLQNRIAELERQIETGEKPIRPTPPEDTPEIVEAKEQIEILQAEIQRMEDEANPPKTDEQIQFERLEQTKNQLDLVLQNRQAAERTKEFEPLSERNADLKSEIDQLRKQVAQMRREMKKGPKADREARREQKIINDLVKAIDMYEERLDNGDFSPIFDNSPKPVTEKVAALRKLRDQRAAVYQAMKRAQKPVLTREERINRIRQANLQRQIDEYRRRYKEKDFSEPEKPATVIDDEKTAKLRYERDREKQRYLDDLIKWRVKEMNAFKRFMIYIGESFNFTRAVITSFDFSAALRQGGVIVLSRPIRSAKAFAPMFRAAFSNQKNHEILRGIETRPNARFYKQAGLYLADMETAELSKQEEKYMSRFATKQVEINGIDINPVGASARAYSTFLNVLRADAFDALLDTLTANGKATAEEMEAIANFVNVATGRGVIGKPSWSQIHSDAAKAGGPLLATVFFAPKYVASRFNFLAGQPIYRAPTKRMQKMIVQEYARYFAGVSTVLGLVAMAAMALRDEDDEEPLINVDPRSTDFLKVRFGDTRLDLFSGLLQPTVFIARLATGTKVNSKGEVQALRDNPWGSDLEKDYGSGGAFGEITRFLRSKLAPIPGSIINLQQGENVIGQPTDLPKELQSLMFPLTFADAGDLYKEQGVVGGTIMTGAVIFGVGAATYGDGGWSHKHGEIQMALDKFREDFAAAETDQERMDVWMKAKADHPWLLSEGNLKRYADAPANRGRYDSKTGEFVPYRVGQPVVNKKTGKPTLVDLPEWARRSPRDGSPRSIVRKAAREVYQQATFEDLSPAAEYSETLRELLTEKNPDDLPGSFERRAILKELEDAEKAIKLEELEQMRQAERGG